MGRARYPQPGEIEIAWTLDLRLRYLRLCEYYPWLSAATDTIQFYMADRSLYRPAYVAPGVLTPGGRPLPERPLPHARAIAAWRWRDLEARWATSDRLAGELCALELEFCGAAATWLKGVAPMTFPVTDRAIATPDAGA